MEVPFERLKQDRIGDILPPVHCYGVEFAGVDEVDMLDKCNILLCLHTWNQEKPRYESCLLPIGKEDDVVRYLR